MKYLLVLLFVLLAGPAAADPVTLVIGAIGSAGSWLFGGTVLANLVLGGLAAAAKYALGAMRPKPKSEASKTETQYGENLVREVGMGTFGTMGHHVYRNAFGKGNRMVQDVYKLSDFRCLELLRVSMDGEWKNLAPNEETKYGDTWGRKVLDVHEGGEVWVRFHSGTMDQAADPQLIAHANPAGRWTPAHRGAGCCYVVVTSRMEADNLTSPASLLFEVRGAPLYDPRFDTTVGGSGPQRQNDQNTWAYSDNPAVMMFNLERGIYNGTERIVGRGTAMSRLPLSEWFTAMNICDEIMPDGSKRYTAALIASSGDGVTHDSNMTPLREACAGSWVESVSGEYPIVGANQAVIATITDDDINWEKPFTLSLTRPRAELVNTVAGSYISPDAFYETVPLATRIDETALALDRERLASKVDFTAVTDHRVGDRLGDIAIRASRYQANGQFTIHPKFLELKVGSWINYQSGRYNFTKTFQVLSKSLGAMGEDGTRDVAVTLQEVGNGIFDPTAYETNPPVPIPVGPPDYLGEVHGFDVFPNIVQGDDGDEHPGVRLLWDAIEDVTVAGVEIQYWPDNDPTQVFNDYVTKDVTVVQIVNGLTSLTDWWVRTRLRVASGTRPVAWSAPVPFRTLDARGDQSPIDYEGLADDLKGYLGWIGPQVRELIRQAEELATLTADNHNSNYSDIQRLTRQLSSTFGNAQAMWQEDIIVATGPNSAIGQQLTRINAQLWDNTGASIIQLLQVRVDGIEDDVVAQANLITQLSSNVGEISANATFRMGTYVAPSGWNSRIGMEVRGGTTESYKSAGLFLDVTSTQARIALIAEQIVFSNGTEFFKPFVIQNNVMYGEGFVMDWAKIVNVQIQWAQIQNAVVDNLIVGTSNLDFNAVTASSQMTYTGTYPSNVHIMGTLIVNSPQGNTGLLDWSCNGRIYGQSSIVSSTTIRLINSTTGVELKSFIVTKPAGTDSQNFTLSTMAIDASAVAGNNTYIVRKGYSDTEASGNIDIYNTSYLKSLVWKR
ncbi:phage tail protein [Brucella intermedia]|uniref:phage tail protein n=1 Tax=Brucella intermedia TaxID=94625 RepID=UPI00244C4836|nr:phage tail protein [Brucella intermedia]WGG61953.1 phage tail protein [Brucella intermedia]